MLIPRLLHRTALSQCRKKCSSSVMQHVSWYHSHVHVVEHSTFKKGKLSTEPVYATPEEAVSVIKSKDIVFLHSACATPRVLVEAMTARHEELSEVEVVHMSSEHKASYIDYPDAFRDVSFFVSPNVRAAVQAGKADYIPIFLSEISSLFYPKPGEAEAILPLDVAMLSVSPPDQHGFVTLGPSVDISLSAAKRAKITIGVVNNRMPRTHGAGQLHVSHFQYLCEHDEPLPEMRPKPGDSEVYTAIGKHIAELIKDGSCLQMGIGSIPDAVLAQLTNHRDLGIHTEMFSDGLIDLVNSGAVTNHRKRWGNGQIVTSFVLGTQRLFDFVDDNLGVQFMPSSRVNDTHIIRLNEDVVSINSCLQCDLTGQIASDTIGSKVYSGVGGQMDFVRGASLSEGGKAILAFQSTAGKNHDVSRIVPSINQYAGVVTTRAHVHYVTTEFGTVNLFGKSLSQRAKLLISIAHPKFRGELERYAREDLNLRMT